MPDQPHEQIGQTLAEVREYVETEMDELRHHRKVVGMDREGNPEFQYSHDSARYEVLGEILSILEGRHS
ncbi:hypothetical protein [Nocardia wallacei]|uniref:hypothetical protein n=1 Tax=Nocardia wallacei TaxID=480035 RepID=UPI002455635D|nr:hypothetical protein [Nocardia wallacei]